MHHGLSGWDPVLGLKLEQVSQQLHSFSVQPGGVETQWLGTIYGIVSVDKLHILADPRPSLLCGRAQDLQVVA